MAIKLVDEYVNSTPADADYPGGSFKNATTGAGVDGTPLEKKWANDWLGYFQALLAATGIVPSGAPDTATSSQYLDALWQLIRTQATTTVRGAVELATDAEVQTGADVVRAVTPASLSARTATTTRTGVVELATDAEMLTTDAVRAVTPARLRLGFSVSLAASGYIVFPTWLSGLIIQWGSVAVAQMDNYSITFPVSFPSLCAFVIGGWVGQDSVAGILGNTSRTVSGVTGNMNGTGAATVNYFTIGY